LVFNVLLAVVFGNSPVQCDPHGSIVSTINRLWQQRNEKTRMRRIIELEASVKVTFLTTLGDGDGWFSVAKYWVTLNFG
jgi:hypothetical protein